MTEKEQIDNTKTIYCCFFINNVAEQASGKLKSDLTFCKKNSSSLRATMANLIDTDNNSVDMVPKAFFSTQNYSN